MFVHCIELLLLFIAELIKIVDGFILHTLSISTIHMNYFINLYTKNVVEDYLDISSKIFKLKEGFVMVKVSTCLLL